MTNDTPRDRVETDRCHFCPKRTDIEVHHIVPQRFRGSDQRDNLVAVCDRCHQKLERLYDRSFYAALGIKDTPEERHQHFECFVRGCDGQACGYVVWKEGDRNWYCAEHLEEKRQNGHGKSLRRVDEGTESREPRIQDGGP